MARKSCNINGLDRDHLMTCYTDKSTDFLRKVGIFLVRCVHIDLENPYSEEATQFGDNAELHLFICSILFESKEEAENKWKKFEENSIGAALIASSLLKSISKIAKREAELDLAKYVMQIAREYEQNACDKLSELYHKNRNRAYQYLIQPLEGPFRSINALELANANHLKTFMGHTCCQTKLNMNWRGKMAAFTPWWQIVLAIFLPILVPTITFTTDKRLRRQETSSSESSFYRVGSGSSQGSISVLDALYHLYVAPISVFATNTIAYLCFLGLFSYFVLVELAEQITTLEFIIWGWAFTMLCGELRQIRYSDGRTTIMKMRFWFASLWNRYDLAMFFTGVVTIILRLSLKRNEAFEYVRYFYSFTVALFYIRFLQSFLIEEKMGPKIIMLGKMIIDVLIFVRVFLIFLLSFGIMYTASLYPNSKPTLQLLKRIFYVPYWQIYGEIFLDFLEGDQNGCIRDESIWREAGEHLRCPEVKSLVPVLGAVYMFLANILLINLLIAWFSTTFETIHKQSEKVWRFYLYRIVREYHERPVIPHPFIILAHIDILRRVICSEETTENDFRSNTPWPLEDEKSDDGTDTTSV